MVSVGSLEGWCPCSLQSRGSTPSPTRKSKQPVEGASLQITIDPITLQSQCYNLDISACPSFDGSPRLHRAKTRSAREGRSIENRQCERISWVDLAQRSPNVLLPLPLTGHSMATASDNMERFHKWRISFGLLLSKPKKGTLKRVTSSSVVPTPIILEMTASLHKSKRSQNGVAKQDTAHIHVVLCHWGTNSPDKTLLNSQLSASCPLLLRRCDDKVLMYTWL